MFCGTPVTSGPNKEVTVAAAEGDDLILAICRRGDAVHRRLRQPAFPADPRKEDSEMAVVGVDGGGPKRLPIRRPVPATADSLVAVAQIVQKRAQLRGAAVMCPRCTRN